MIISPDAERIVLRLENPDRVLTVIPSAKKFTFGGKELVSVKHGMDETRVLRNMGIKVPSPVLYHYDWPGRHKPFAAQLDTTEFLTFNANAFVLNDMGTGKTLSSLWAYDYLRSIGEVRRMLVVAPLSTLERTWADEVFRNFPHLTVGTLHGTKERRQKMLAEDFDIYLINHDGLSVIEAELIAKADIDVVIVDEIASFRNSATRRWKALNKVCGGRKRVWGMTGTPTPNNPTDAWAQCRLISPHLVPKYFGAFRDSVMKQLSPFKWAAREGATEIVANAMQPAIRFSREQCVDLPPAIFLPRKVELTPEQASAYKIMMKSLKAEFAEGQVIAVNEAVKMSKLVQIACGVVYAGSDLEVVIPCEPRINEVKETIEQAGTKVIVFVPFKAVLRYVTEKLSEHFTVATISGDVPKHQRDTIFNAFQHDADPKVLIAQPAAMSHGLTLTAASTVIWYAPVTSHEIYQQANARVSRPGQLHTQFIVNIEATEIERRIYARLRDKEKLQGLLLDTLQEC